MLADAFPEATVCRLNCLARRERYESSAFSSSLLAARFVVGISWRSLLAAPTLTQFVKRTDTGGIAVRGAAIRSTPERSLLAV